MDPQTLENIKGQQAKFSTIQNLLQSGDIESGSVGFYSVYVDCLNRISALLPGDEGSKATVASSGPRLQLKNRSTVQQRKSGKEANVSEWTGCTCMSL